MQWLYEQVEQGRVPDALIRLGIRQLLRRRLRERSETAELIEHMRSAPIALNTAEANEQHYELPADFFLRVLGPRLKYSSCYWPSGVDSLAAAEEAALALTCERAAITDGMDILELGCGWGSLSLWMAEHYPNSRIFAVSNSHGQRRFIEGRAQDHGFENLTVATHDMNDFAPPSGQRFDRVVSIEMFEHMRNYRKLLARIASWLRADGQLFVHIFCHRSTPYFFEDRGRPSDWMARHFFTGGLMPNEEIFSYFEDHLVTAQRWRVNGKHYERTLLSWLAEQDRQRDACMQLFEETYGPADAKRWFWRWRIFFLACAELFAFRGGEEWFVIHSLLRHRS